jgi:hypothetical protein
MNFPLPAGDAAAADPVCALTSDAPARTRTRVPVTAAAGNAPISSYSTGPK